MAALYRAPNSCGPAILCDGPCRPASALSVRLFRILRNWQCPLFNCDHFVVMASLYQLGHGIFRSGQPEVHLSRFRESGVLGMTAELCRTVPMVLSRCDDAHCKV